MVEKNKLPRRVSLKKKSDIDALLKEGYKISGDCFLLFWQKSEEFQYATLVSGKLGTAPQRNRIKRLAREAIRLNKMKLPKYVKIAILPDKRSNLVNFESLNAEISRIFELIKSRF